MINLDTLAKPIYEAMRFEREDDTPPWVENGNSLAQQEARAKARQIIEVLREPDEGMQQAMYRSCEDYDAPLHDEMECNLLRIKAALGAVLERDAEKAPADRLENDNG